jgi:predicted phosphodiesterase
MMAALTEYHLYFIFLTPNPKKSYNRVFPGDQEVMKRLFPTVCVTFLTVIFISINTPVYAESFRFVVTSDTQGYDGNGVNSDMLIEIVQAAIDEGADFILISGDLVENSPDQGTFKSQLLHWRDIMEPLYDANIGVYPVRGNHDSGPKADWDDVFSGDYALPANGPAGEENITYSFTHKNAFIIGLDQYTTLHSVNQAWLDAQFAVNTQPHVFVFGHEPAFKLAHQDCLHIYQDERDAFWESIVSEGGRAYFCGHDHSYDHARIDDGDGNPNNDVHQIITIGGGGVFYSGGVFNGYNSWWVPLRVDHEDIKQGYMLVEIDGPDVTLTWKHRTDPCVFEAGDIFSYTTNAVEAPSINFPDVNLKTAVAATLGISEPNTTDILSLISLDANSSDINNLAGLEYAANLNQLYLDDNMINDIWPLTKLKNLTTLHLKNNPLDRAAYCEYLLMINANNPGINLAYEPNPNPGDDCIVDFADPNLKAAIETQLGVNDPNFSDVLGMFELHANRKGIPDLNGLEYAKNLSWLQLHRNKISDISTLVKMKYLTWLVLSRNQIENISSLSKLTNLSWLDLYNNQIDDISVLSQLPLTRLRLGVNPLNTPAYCTHLPSIEANNPVIDISYDTNPNPLTNDCSADFDDLAAFLSQWLAIGCDTDNNWCDGADLDHIDDVDFKDFAQLVNLY